MSALCVFTPIVVSMAWPAVSALAAAALASLGYAAAQDSAAKSSTREGSGEVELTVERSQGFENTLGEEESLTLRRGDLTLRFRKGADGRLKLCVSGEGLAESELAAAGKEAMDRFLQEYSRRKIAAELRKRGFSLEEERLDDGTIRLKAKRWA